MSFIETLKTLPFERRIALAAAVIAVVIAVGLMGRGVMQTPMALLYAGLEPAHAGEIIEALERDGVVYEIRGEAIFTAEAGRDAVRFALARQGLPKQSVQGYELLDSVNGFSVTSEMYNATYWRAKEGELTRTILAIPGVISARVHIGASLRSGFSRSQPAQTASVTLASSRALSANQAEAIQYMVALAVSGLDPNEVAVIDSRNGMVAGPGVDRDQTPSVAAEDQAAALERKITHMLEARVGPGNARVSAVVDVSRDRQHVSQVTYDPDSRIVRNRSSMEAAETAPGGAGAVTVASNLPQGEGQAGGGLRESENASETVSYDFSETRTETERLPGRIERVSIAVLLNDAGLPDDVDPGTAAAAATLVAEIEQLVRSAAGLDDARGDALTVEFMPFQMPVETELQASPSMTERLLERHLWSGVQALLLGLVVLVLGLGVVRPMLRPAPAAGDATAPGSENTIAPDPSADPVDFLKDYTNQRQDDAAALLKDWLNDNRELAANE